MMFLTYMLGIITGVVAGIIANLLTPSMKSLWGKLLSMQERNYRAQIQQEIQPLQYELDQLNRFRASERDLYIYLFRWLLGIMSIFVAAVACGLVAVGNSVAKLLLVSLALLILAAVTTLVLLFWCGNFTAIGMQKRTAELEGKIAKLGAKLPER